MDSPSDPAPPLKPHPTLRPIKLVKSKSGRLFVVRSDEERKAGRSFTPFPLPYYPLSKHCWMTGFGTEFFRRHRRCIAALLLVDCKTHHWVPPIIPTQACGTDGACWTFDVGKAGDLPASRRVAGSFQTRQAKDLMEASATVPQFDGLHIVQVMPNQSAQESMAYFFLRVKGESSVISPDDFLFDDWELALREAAERMVIE